MTAAPRSAPGPDGRPTNPFEPFDRAEIEQAIGARFEARVGRGPDRLAVKMGADLAAGVPFYRNQLLGDAVYTLALFGGHAVLSRLARPALKPAH